MIFPLSRKRTVRALKRSGERSGRISCFCLLISGAECAILIFSACGRRASFRTKTVREAAYFYSFRPLTECPASGIIPDTTHNGNALKGTRDHTAPPESRRMVRDGGCERFRSPRSGRPNIPMRISRRGRDLPLQRKGIRCARTKGRFPPKQSGTTERLLRLSSQRDAFLFPDTAAGFPTDSRAAARHSGPARRPPVRTYGSIPKGAHS